MIRALRRGLIVLLLLCPAAAQAMTALLYQPQLRDMDVAEAQWPAVFADVRGRGFDTLVLQWTLHGEEFGDPRGRDWLQRRVREARAQGLRIVPGLQADPDFFRRQQQPAASLEQYLRRQRQRDLQLARSWVQALGAEAVAGWYLPLEIDDHRWRDAAAHDVLLRHLEQAQRDLQTLVPRPVYVTTFFVGNMTPQRYRELLRRIGATGVRVWVQDGAGTGRLSAVERALYLDGGADCTAPAAHGVVHELFRQTGDDAAFSAEPLGPDAAAAALAQRAPCGGDSVFFSLRYLPSMLGILAR